MSKSENEFSEFKLNLNHISKDVLHILLRETKWYSLPELDIGYNDSPIEFYVKIPNKDLYMQKINSSNDSYYINDVNRSGRVEQGES